MISRLLLIVIVAVSSAFADEAGPLLGASTNTFIVSETVTKLRWQRTAIMAGADNRPLDPTGQLVAAADAAALGVTAERAGEIGDSARDAMTNAVQALIVVTNQIPSSAQHIAVSIPGMGSPNLQAVVIAEGRDGSNDWQTVEFNQLLAVPPSRQVVYSYPGGSASVECTWEYPWSATSTVHRCTFPRPPLLDVPHVIRSRRVDLFGGAKGLSFGTALVKIDGSFTFTGSVTNNLTGQVLNFENGVLK